MADAREGIVEMAIADIAAQIRSQLHLGGGVDHAQLQRLLGDNRKSVDLHTQSELRACNHATTVQLKCAPIDSAFLPAV